MGRKFGWGLARKVYRVSDNSVEQYWRQIGGHFGGYGTLCPLYPAGSEPDCDVTFNNETYIINDLKFYEIKMYVSLIH